MNRIAYYLFVLPLSYLPLYLLYGLSPIIYFICYYVISYRKNVVRLNIQHSFPEKTAKEHEFIMQAFYLHLSQVIIEGIKNLTISQKELSKRFKITNPEVVNDLLKVQKSVILVGGHYGNWEWLITSQKITKRKWPQKRIHTHFSCSGIKVQEIPIKVIG